MTKVTHCETVVARDAPSTPILSPHENINMGSRITFSAAPVITAMDETFTEDSALAAQLRLCAGRLKRAAINIQNA